MKKRAMAAFYGYSIFTHLLPLYAVYAAIINDAFKSPLILSTLLAFWSLTVLALEVPSGALADSWSKKSVAVIGQASKVITCIIWFVYDSYPAFLLGFIFWGIQESFCSGSVDALLFESASRDEGESGFERQYSRCYLLSTVACTAAIFSGGLLYRTRPVYVFVISIATSLAAFLFALLFPRDAGGANEGKPKGYLRMIIDALKQVKGSPMILRLLAYSIGYVAVIGTVEEFVPVHLQSLGLSALLFSCGLAGIMAAQSVGAAISQLIVLSSERAQYLLAAMSCIGLVLLRFAGPIVSIGLLFGIFAVIGILEVKLSACLNEAIEGERATVLSLQSLAMNAAAIVLSLAIGSVAEAFSLSTSFLALGSASALLLLLLLKAGGGPRRGSAR